MIWLAALATCPAPASPTCVTVLPIAWKIGRTFLQRLRRAACHDCQRPITRPNIAT